jgi:hypothetical protein
MPLIEQTMTEKNLAAHRQNARQSQGAATPEGKERARAANLRHGYYSQMREEALVALGEDPEALAALVAGAREQWRPANAYQASITDHLASLLWRIQRAERLQESQAANHIRQVEAKRREAARELRARGAEVLGFLDDLRRAVARPDFYTPYGCFEHCAELLEQNPSANMEEIFRLLHRLGKPHWFTAPPPEPLGEAMSDVDWQTILRNDAAGEYDESAVPHPEIPVAEGPERDPLRAELRDLADEELRQATESWQKKIAAKEAPLSACARDVIAMEVSKEMELLRREERSCFREFSRLTSDLMKLQKASELQDEKPKVKNQEQPAQVQDSGARADASWDNTRENEGASGYVEENKETAQHNGVTINPLPAGQPHLAAAPSHDAAAPLHDNVTEPNATLPAMPLTSVLPTDGRGDANPLWAR